MSHLNRSLITSALFRTPKGNFTVISRPPRLRLVSSSETTPPVQPTPDYGSLGPGADVSANQPIIPRAGNVRIVAAIAVGALLALPFGTGAAQRQWGRLAGAFISRQTGAPSTVAGQSRSKMEGQRPQSQAQMLLQRAVDGDESANDLISSRADTWHGRLQLSSQLNALVDRGLNAPDMRVRVSAIEVELAAFDISKTADSADRLMQEAAAGPQNQRIWALWTLGILANRGVETSRITDFLLQQLHDSNPEIRRWTVEGLSYVGSDGTIQPLLQSLHDDASPTVRERAACALAQSGMLSHDQRETAVPKLLDYAEDASLDAPTHAWVFHALRDITAQTFPDDAASWLNWYNTRQN